MASYRWQSGDYTDVCATSNGYALARRDGLTLIVQRGTAGSLPVEVWRRTTSEPIVDLRIACRTDTDELRVIAKGTRTNTARYFTSAAETSKGTAYGECPVLLQFSGGDWIGYIARTAKTYTRWIFSGAEPAATANPFTLAGSNLGMIQVIGSTVTWRETTPQTAATVGQLKRTTIGGVIFYVPMVLGGVTVGQSEGPPTNTNQIIAAHGGVASSILPILGYNPHLAVLPDGSFVFACRTLSTDLSGPQPHGSGAMGSAALVFAPPWPVYNAQANIGPMTDYPPYNQRLSDEPFLKDGKINQHWQRYLLGVENEATSAVVLGSVNVVPGGGMPPVPPPPLTQDADVLVGDDGSGFPHARVVTDTANIEKDIATPNVIELDLTDTTVTPGTYGDATHVGQFTVDQKGRLTQAAEIPITTTVDHVVMSDGATPPSPMSIGNQFMYIGYTP